MSICADSYLYHREVMDERKQRRREKNAKTRIGEVTGTEIRVAGKSKYTGKCTDIDIHQAICDSNVKAVCEVLAAKPNVINTQNKSGCSPLHLASMFDNHKIVELLVKKGAYVNQLDFQGLSPLQYAVRQGYLRSAEILLDNGSDVNRVAIVGQLEPLFIAIHEVNPDMVELLLRYNANNNKRSTETGNTALLEALDLFSGKVNTPIHEIIVYILNICHNNMNIVNNEGNTALHIVCSKGLHYLMDPMIKDTSIINRRNNKGQTPLHLAVESGNNKTISILRNNGADIHAKTYDGVSIYDTAMNADNEELCMHILYDYGYTKVLPMCILFTLCTWVIVNFI